MHCSIQAAWAWLPVGQCSTGHMLGLAISASAHHEGGHVALQHQRAQRDVDVHPKLAGRCLLLGTLWGRGVWVWVGVVMVMAGMGHSPPACSSATTRSALQRQQEPASWQVRLWGQKLTPVPSIAHSGCLLRPEQLRPELASATPLDTAGTGP